MPSKNFGFVTLFPEMIEQALSHSIMGRAQQDQIVNLETSNPRDFATDAHKSVDDTPFGGGPGMVMMAPLVQQAVQALDPQEGAEIILTDPAGEKFTQDAAEDLAGKSQVIFICGHYEGIDERVRTKIATRAYSVGDFVLTGGELPALTMADAIIRLLPGVLGDPESHRDDSHSNDGLLGFPLYTKPQEFLGESVPDVLLSGHHKNIARWRRQQQLIRTRIARPDLFCRADLKDDDLDLL
jgi:tRNA (guanine37-N1)-methyltransferase